MVLKLILMVIIRSTQMPGVAVVSSAPDGALDDDPLQAQAVEAFVCDRPEALVTR